MDLLRPYIESVVAGETRVAMEMEGNKGNHGGATGLRQFVVVLACNFSQGPNWVPAMVVNMSGLMS